MSDFTESNGHPPGSRILAVSSMPMIDGIGVTLVREVPGWRFHAWYTHDSLPACPEPSAADRALFFDHAEEAGAYFKQEYGGKLRGT